MSALASLPMRTGSMLLSELIDLYMAHYAGRDTTRVQRLTWWRGQIGAVPLEAIGDDNIHAALEGLARQPTRFFAGNDADGKPIYKAKHKPRAPATINRYCAAVAAVFTWAIKRRIAPKGWVHPCPGIEREAEGLSQRFCQARHADRSVVNATRRPATDRDRIAVDRPGFWRTEKGDHIRDLARIHEVVDRISGRHLFFHRLR